ncbi:flagellar brake protein [Pleionea sediminis]|uniref:flagellar brake protein n=1 Tax=Pleionea sediminis TaxID=2569479 RepID=UPI001186878C|nr:flagellar brake protein [Pleionea sediminis]
MDETLMRFSDLGLKMGDVMQIQVSAESEARYPVKLLGFLPDCSVIISAPSEKKGKPIFLKEDQLVTLRFVVNHVASGFTSKVLGMRTSPSPYIHLEMPKEVEAVEVRNAVRVNTEIPATLINETHKSNPMAVNLVNLSVLGGRLESQKKIALIGDELSLTMTLSLDDIDKVVTLDCVVRNKGKVDERKEGEEGSQILNWYGFHFKFQDDEDRLLLKAFVYQEILRSLHLL